LIPCNPVRILEQIYGRNWSLPIKSGYGFKNLGYGYNKYDKWSESRRYYDYYGKFNLNRTLKELNENVGEDGIVKTNHVFDEIS
jgi:hypothetical protein